MSTHYAPIGTDVPTVPLCAAFGTTLTVEVEVDRVAYTFTPDLTAEQADLFDAYVGRARLDAPMPVETYAAVRGELQTLRDLRQMGRAAFMALTAAERDRLGYDAHVATTIVLLALLRD